MTALKTLLAREPKRFDVVWPTVLAHDVVHGAVGPRRVPHRRRPEDGLSTPSRRAPGGPENRNYGRSSIHSSSVEGKHPICLQRRPRDGAAGSRDLRLLAGVHAIRH